MSVWTPASVPNMLVIVSYGLLRATPLPIPLPFVGGSDLSIDILSSAVGVPSNGVVSVKIQVPALARRATVYGQPIGFDTNKGKVWLGNTFAIDVR